MSQVLDAVSSEAAPEQAVAPLTPEAVREMVARMSDDQVRAMLLERLDAVAQVEVATAEDAPGIMTRITEIGTGLLERWSMAIRTLPMLFSAQAKAISNFLQTFQGERLWSLLGLTVLTLAVGLAAERLAIMGLKRWRRGSGPEALTDIRGAANFLISRFGYELFGLVVFYAVISLVGRRLLDPQQLAAVAPFVLYLIWLPRIGAAFSRLMLAPARPEMRLVNIDDTWAAYLHRNQIGLFFLIGLLLFIVDFNLQNGLARGESLIAFWLNLAIHLYIALIAWTARVGLTDMMRGSDPDRTPSDETIARAYPYLAIAVAVVIWFAVEIIIVIGNPETIRLLSHGAHYVTMFWLLMAPAMDTLIRAAVRHFQPPIIGDGAVAEAAYRSTKRSYIRIGRMIAAVFVVLMIANQWDVDLRDLAASSVGSGFGENLVEFALTVAVGYILFEMLSVWVNRRLARERAPVVKIDAESGGGDGGGAGKSRLATVLPLILLTGQASIAVIFGLLAASALGIDIAPLLAGAGIIGLAIGFGAQKLVTDIVSGIFFLIDDAFRLGEYVDVGGTMGTVEKISIRSMQLRHHRGNVHTIPYGGISKVTNFSRDWVIMKLMFTVPFGTDPNKVKKVFKKIGAEMGEDPLYKDDFLEPFKSQGVLEFDDVGIVIRGKFMAKPGTQFTIRKEILNRVQTEFKANGIDFARREVRVEIPGLEDHEDLTAEQKASIKAGVSGAVQAQLAEEEAAAKSKS